MKRLLTPFLCGTVIVCGSYLPGNGPARASAPISRAVFFSATDSKGAYVTDLIASEVTVKEGGKARAVSSLAPATGRLQVSMVIDDGGLGTFQAGVTHFIDVTLGRVDYAISILNPQPLKLADYVSDVPALRTAVSALGQRGRVQQDGTQMIEAVSWAAKELRARQALRPVIVVLTNGGEPTATDVNATGRSVTSAFNLASRDQPIADVAEFVLNDLKGSGASLHVVYVNGVSRGKVMGEGPKLSGGLLQNAASNSAVDQALSEIAAHLIYQYRVTYVLPDGTKPSDRLEITTSRKGVTLRAPQRITER